MTYAEQLIQQAKNSHGHDVIDVEEQPWYGDHVKLICSVCSEEWFVWTGPAEKATRTKKRRNPHMHY